MARDMYEQRSHVMKVGFFAHFQKTRLNFLAVIDCRLSGFDLRFHPTSSVGHLLWQVGLSQLCLVCGEVDGVVGCSISDFVLGEVI